MHRLLRVIADDLRDYANGDLPFTPDALHRLAMALDDICDAAEADAGVDVEPGREDVRG